MHPTIHLPAFHRHGRAGAAPGAGAPAGHRLRSVALTCAVTLLLLALCACSAPEELTGPVPAGIWGGSQATLTVYADSATLDLPCAAGRIVGPLVGDAQGRFELGGYWAVQAGPIGINGLNWQAARYSGRRADDTLELSIHLSSGTDVGPLSLKRGVTENFPRCL